MSGRVPDWARQDMRKSSAATPKSGVKQMPSLFHGTKVQKFADGGEVEQLKQEGLAASADDKVGLWDRIKAGNIDDPNSEAYRRWGAGRGEEGRMQKREDARDAEMTRLMNARKPDDRNEMDKASDAAPASKPSSTVMEAPKAKPKAKPAPKPEPKPEMPDQTEAETRRLNRQAAEAARVKPRPGFNWPSQRSDWDAKYEKTHNHDGTPK